MDKGRAAKQSKAKHAATQGEESPNYRAIVSGVQGAAGLLLALLVLSCGAKHCGCSPAGVLNLRQGQGMLSHTLHPST